MAQHSMRLVDGESCLPPCADNITWPRSASRKVAPRKTTTKGWPPGGDRQSRVRAGLSLLLGVPAGPVARPGRRPPVAPWSCEMNAGATSPWDLLQAGATPGRLRRDRCSEPLHAPQDQLRRSGLLRWTMSSTLGAYRRSWRLLSVIQPYAPDEGGSHIGRGTVTQHEHIFSCGFLCCTIHNRSAPDHGHLTTMCHRLRKRWDENTPSSKGPHSLSKRGGLCVDSVNIDVNHMDMDVNFSVVILCRTCMSVILTCMPLDVLGSS